MTSNELHDVLSDLTNSSADDTELASVNGISRSFGIRAADTEGKRNTASLLINKMYSWKGYGSTFSVSGEPDQLTLVATDYHKGDAIGTLTVGLDARNGLLVDNVYREEADQLRAQGCRLCEMTKFAIERHINSKHVLAALFHVAFIYAHHLNKRTDLLIEVNPAHTSFYRRLLCFEQYGPEKLCPRVDAPSVLLRLELSRASEMIRRHGGRGDSSSERSLYPYAFSEREEEGIIARLASAETPSSAPEVREALTPTA